MRLLWGFVFPGICISRKTRKTSSLVPTNSSAPGPLSRNTDWIEVPLMCSHLLLGDWCHHCVLALAGRKSGRRLKRDLKLPVKQGCEAGWMLEQKKYDSWQLGGRGETRKRGRERTKKETDCWLRRIDDDSKQIKPLLKRGVKLLKYPNLRGSWRVNLLKHSWVFSQPQPHNLCDNSLPAYQLIISCSRCWPSAV